MTDFVSGEGRWPPTVIEFELNDDGWARLTRLNFRPRLNKAAVYPFGHERHYPGRFRPGRRLTRSHVAG